MPSAAGAMGSHLGRAFVWRGFLFLFLLFCCELVRHLLLHLFHIDPVAPRRGQQNVIVITIAIPVCGFEQAGFQ